MSDQNQKPLEKLGYVVLLGFLSVGGNLATGKLFPVGTDGGRSELQIERLEKKIDLLSEQVGNLQEKLFEKEKLDKANNREIWFEIEELKRRSNAKK